MAEPVVRRPVDFRFSGPDTKRFVADRERIYLDRSWNGLSAIPFDERRPAAPLRAIKALCEIPPPAECSTRSARTVSGA
jgi:hypothetical protein